ncbi:hypothetical protein [Methanolobus sp.]|jgi:hypothetical protein|uniref:hypothetical protein n=1 Tax=Methanolobus sp. TaxID=1874737 RepID=UPI0025F282C1|nr:hypothetical protein [Methanolobus sp.]
MLRKKSIYNPKEIEESSGKTWNFAIDDRTLQTRSERHWDQEIYFNFETGMIFKCKRFSVS